MLPKAFVDINIAIDFPTKRQPFDAEAMQLFNQADIGKIELYVSSNIFPFLFYLLTKLLQSKVQAFTVLKQFRLLVKILPVTEKEIDRSLVSEFKDLEDAVVYFTAEHNEMDVFLTRNLNDFRDVRIPIMTAAAFLKSL